MDRPVLSPDQLTPADEQILDMLRDGRVTAPYVAEERDLALEYVRSRLKRFVEHEHVRKVHSGLYELVEDPREDGDS